MTHRDLVKSYLPYRAAKSVQKTAPCLVLFFNVRGNFKLSKIRGCTAFFPLIYRREKCETCWFKLRESSNIFLFLAVLFVPDRFSSRVTRKSNSLLKWSKSTRFTENCRKFWLQGKQSRKKKPFQDAKVLISHESLTFIYWSFFSSVYLTLCVTVERYVAVCLPLRARSICTHRWGRERELRSSLLLVSNNQLVILFLSV